MLKFRRVLFHASQGRVVEKDYTELCMMLNIPVYKHVSKIRETMGRSLDELSQIGYLSNWDVRPMVTKQGFKLVLQAGEKLLHVLAISQRKSLAASAPALVLDERRQTVVKTLMAWGITETKAASLAREQDPEELLEQIEYTRHLVEREGRKIDSPAGFLIYAIESHLPVPASFSHFRQRQEKASDEPVPGKQRLSESYGDYVRQRLDEEIHSRFPGEELGKRLKRLISNRVRGDEKFRAMTAPLQEALAEESLRQEIRDSGVLLSFEEWCASVEQISLFGAHTSV